MKLKKYFEDMHIIKARFAAELGVSTNTLKNFVLELREPRLSTALDIERITNHNVTCEDLRLAPLALRKSNTKLQKKTKNKKKQQEQ